MDIPAAPKLSHAFTLDVSLAPPHEIGQTVIGDQRFIPITGGSVHGPKLRGSILAGGGDWNIVKPDGLVHIFAKYTMSLTEEDGSQTMVTITNEGIGRASQEVMRGVFTATDPSKFSQGSMGLVDNVSGGEVDNTWYTRTWPKFEVQSGSTYSWLCGSMWLGILRPPQSQGRSFTLNSFTRYLSAAGRYDRREEGQTVRTLLELAERRACAIIADGSEMEASCEDW